MSSPAPTSYLEGPRHGQVTPDNQGDVLLVVAWFLMVVMILATCLRLLIRFTTTHVPGLDDAVVFFATLVGIGETVAISLSVNNGLGTRISKLNRLQILGLEKDAYVATILYLLTLTIAKTSTLLLIARLVGIKFHLHLIRGVAALVLLWSVASVFAVAFQCGIPRPWDYLEGKCFNPIIFWDIVGAVDILVDVTLIALPMLIVWNLHMNWRRKLFVVSAFASRLVVIGAAIARLVFIRRLKASSDPTYYSLAYAIATQCQTTLSVVIACVPALKPYMDRAQSGFLSVSLEQRGVGGTYDYGNSYPMQSTKRNGKFSKASNSGPSSKSNTSQVDNKYSTRTKSGSHHPLRSDCAENSVVVSSGRHDQDEACRDENRTSEDGTGSEKHIIQKTQTWNISYEDDNRHQHKHTQHSYSSQQVSYESPSADMVHAVSSV